MAGKPNLSTLRLDEQGQVVEKWCRTHNEGAGAWLPASQFRQDARYAGGLYFECVSCMNARKLAMQKAKPEPHRERQRRYAENNPEKIREHSRQLAARRKEARAKAREQKRREEETLKLLIQAAAE
jgi:hypothetical protein